MLDHSIPIRTLCNSLTIEHSMQTKGKEIWRKK
jgi:hypothetical protein